MRKKYKLLTILFSIIAVTIIFVMPEPVMADDVSPKLTIYYFVQKSGIDTPIEGAVTAICKVADFDLKRGRYVILSDYEHLKKMKGIKDVTFDDLSVSDWMELAGRFYDSKKEPDDMAVTDEKGICVFSDMEQGMYLVYQVSADGEAEDYEYFAPYLISVPMQAGDEWIYDILSEPKTKELGDKTADDVTEKQTESTGKEEETTQPPTTEPTTDKVTEQPTTESSSEEQLTTKQPSEQEAQPSAADVSANAGKMSNWDRLFVKTGDDTSWFLFIGAMMFALVLVVLAGHEKRRADDDE